MKVLVSKNLILKKSRKIRTSPSINAVKEYKFGPTRQYNKFVKWIGSSNDALNKVKLPKKKEIEGLSSNAAGIINSFGMFLASLALDPEGREEILNKVKNNSGKIAAGGALLGGGVLAKKRLFKPKVLKKVKPNVNVKSKLTAPNRIAIKSKRITAQSLARKKGNPFPHIATGEKTPKSKVGFNKRIAKLLKREGGEKVAQQTTKKLSQQVSKQIGKKAGKFIPGFGSLISLGFAANEFAEGDMVGGSLALASAIPVLGWAAIGVDIARDLGAFEGTPLGLNESEKKGKDKQVKEEIDGQVKKEEVITKKSKINISGSIVKFRLAVEDFEKIMSSNTMVVNSKTQVDNITDKTLGALDFVTYGAFDFDMKGNSLHQEVIQQPFKRFWNWFVPPPEKSNEPSVAAGIRTPDVGFKHVVSMSDGDQLFGSGNNIVLVPQDQTVQQQNKGGIVPVPIPSGGGGGVAVVTPSDSEIVNSMWTTILLTKLAQ